MILQPSVLALLRALGLLATVLAARQLPAADVALAPVSAPPVLPRHYRATLAALRREPRALAEAPPVADANRGSARVQRISEGRAEYTGGDGAWKPLTEGLRLAEGAIVRTDSACIVDLFLGPNGPVVRLTPDTVLALRRLRLETRGGETTSTTLLGLARGRILGHVKRQAAGSRYEVETPQATAGIRDGGGKYDIRAGDSLLLTPGSRDSRPRLRTLSGSGAESPAPPPRIEPKQLFGQGNLE
jgi:hypothetical protein